MTFYDRRASGGERGERAMLQPKWRLRSCWKVVVSATCERGKLIRMNGEVEVEEIAWSSDKAFKVLLHSLTLKRKDKSVRVDEELWIHERKVISGEASSDAKVLQVMMMMLPAIDPRKTSPWQCHPRPLTMIWTLRYFSLQFSRRIESGRGIESFQRERQHRQLQGEVLQTLSGRWANETINFKHLKSTTAKAKPAFHYVHANNHKLSSRSYRRWKI